MPLGREKNHFFKWLFTKMAVLVFGGWESGWGLAGSPRALKNAWICFRTSFSCVGNNLSLQIRSFCENRSLRKCYRTRDPTHGLSSAILLRQDLHFAESSNLPCNEAYKYLLTLSSHLLSMPSWEGKPNGRQLLPRFSLNNDFVRNFCVYLVSWCLHADCTSW